MVNFITNTVAAISFRDFQDCSQNSRKPPCCTDFYEVCYPFYPPLWDTIRESVTVLANFANLLKNRGTSDVHGLFPLSTYYYDILLLVLGTGHLSQGERRGEEQSLSKKRVPTDRYVLGV